MCGGHVCMHVHTYGVFACVWVQVCVSIYVYTFLNLIMWKNLRLFNVNQGH